MCWCVSLDNNKKTFANLICYFVQREARRTNPDINREFRELNVITQNKQIDRTCNAIQK